MFWVPVRSPGWSAQQIFRSAKKTAKHLNEVKLFNEVKHLFSGQKENVKPKLSVLSLFSGCSGLGYGFETDDNFCIVKVYDFNKDAVETYNFNFKGNKTKYFDVNQINLYNFKYTLIFIFFSFAQV